MALMIGLIAGALLATAIFWIGGELPKHKKVCANKGPFHRFHEWTEWVMTGRSEVYQSLNPPRGYVGEKLFMARRCNKCGLPDTKVERNYE